MACLDTSDPIDSALKELRELTELDLSGHSRGAATHSIHKSSSPPESKASTATATSSSDGGQFSRSETLASLESLTELSAQLIEEERWEVALAVVTEEHELMCTVHGESDQRTLQVLGTYAGVLWQLGRGRDARDLLEELVAKRKEVSTSLARASPVPFCMRLSLSSLSLLSPLSGHRTRLRARCLGGTRVTTPTPASPCHALAGRRLAHHVQPWPRRRRIRLGRRARRAVDGATRAQPVSQGRAPAAPRAEGADGAPRRAERTSNTSL